MAGVIYAFVDFLNIVKRIMKLLNSYQKKGYEYLLKLKGLC
jgi:NurA-like 5'-3' nuclease